MSVTCDASAEAVTRYLGFSCHDVNPVVSINNPADLYSWTQPVLELLIIGGAVYAFILAFRRLRDGDGTNLALCLGSLVYLAITEPPLYFPEWFGLDKVYGFIFAHNEFTVQFMYDRLPLYIVAFYPAIITLAYEIVRAFGIFAKRGPVVGALALAFVAQVFYEIFDQLGPQLKWWAWNETNAQVNQPMLGSVPMNSMVLFASVSLGFLAYVVVRLQKKPIAVRALVAGALTPLAMVVASIPSSLFGGDVPGIAHNVTAQTWVLGIDLAMIWLVGGWLVLRDVRSERGAGEPLGRFVRIYPAAFLVVHGLLWLSALPQFLAAKDGITAAGTPIGSGWYVLACFVAASAVLGQALRSRSDVAGRSIPTQS
jgi:hypothetical protein